MCTTVSLPCTIDLFSENVENKHKQVLLSKIFILFMIRMCKKRKNDKEITSYAIFILKPMER